MTTYMNLGC